MGEPLSGKGSVTQTLDDCVCSLQVFSLIQTSTRMQESLYFCDSGQHITDDVSFGSVNQRQKRGQESKWMPEEMHGLVSEEDIKWMYEWVSEWMNEASHKTLKSS